MLNFKLFRIVNSSAVENTKKTNSQKLKLTNKKY